MKPRDRQTPKSSQQPAKRSPRSARTPGSHADAVHHRGLLAAIALAIITLGIYLPSLRNGFVWDDDTHLTQNIVIEPGGLFRSWFSVEQPNYWPLTWTAFWVQWKLVGLKPAFFHFTNILLHCVNVLLVWRILLRLALPGAWLAALIFAVHPVNVETTAWITQLKTLLSMAFYLCSLLVYLKSDQTHNQRRYAGSVALFLAAMLTKPATVMMPLVLLLIAWWRDGGITRTSLLRSLPFFVVSGVLSLTEIWFQYNRSIQETVVRDDTLLARLAGAGWVVCFYASKALLPINLTFVYPRWQIVPMNPLAWLPGLAIIIVFIVAWTRRRSWGRAVLFGFGYFVVTLLPVMGFLNIYYMRYSFVADHWQYVSIPGIIALAACGGTWLVQHRTPQLQNAAGAFAAASVAALALLTVSHQRIYASAVSVWEDTLRKNPNAWIAHQRLGVLAAERGDLRSAEKHFRDTLIAKPGHSEAHYNWGIALAAAGAVDRAIPHYREALRFDPANVEAHNNLGEALAQLGKYDEAIEHFRSATTKRPFASAEINWGLALASQKKYDDAIKHYATAAAIDKRSGEANLNWGAALMAQGKLEAAIAQYREAIRRDPRLASAHHNLAMALEQSRDLAGAAKHYTAAADLEPRNARRHVNLGKLLAKAGKPQDAARSYQAALQIEPANAAARDGLARLQPTGR